MSPFTRNIVLATAAAVLPAIAAAAVSPDRARALPRRISTRVRDIFEDDDSVEGNLRRITARLEDLSHQIDARSAMERVRDTSTTTRILTALAALLLLPAALSAIFFPDRLRAARDRVIEHGPWAHDDDESWDDELEELEDDLEAQRDDAVAAVSKAANRRAD